MALMGQHIFWIRLELSWMVSELTPLLAFDKKRFDVL